MDEKIDNSPTNEPLKPILFYIIVIYCEFR